MIQHLSFFIILLLGTSNLFSCDRDSIFRLAYGELYASINAAYNVRTLLTELKKAEQSIEGLDVIVFLHEKRRLAGVSGPTLPTDLLPQTVRYPFRSGLPTWRYHAVLLDKKTGLVYDMELGNTPLTVQEHYNRLFAREGVDVAANIAIKRLGAHQYIDLVDKYDAHEQSKMKPVIDEIRGWTPGWPEVPLTDLLQAYP